MILTIFVTRKERWLACMSAPLPPLGLPDLVNQITEHPCNIWDKLSHTHTKIHSLFIQNSDWFYLVILFTMQAPAKLSEQSSKMAQPLLEAFPLPASPASLLPSLPLSCSIAFDCILCAGFTCAHVPKNSKNPKENTVYTYGYIHRSLRFVLFGNTIECLVTWSCLCSVEALSPDCISKIIRKLNVNIKKPFILRMCLS